MAVRRPEFIPFCYVTSAIKFIYSATQSRARARKRGRTDARVLPEVPLGPSPLLPLRRGICSPRAHGRARVVGSTGENETRRTRILVSAIVSDVLWVRGNIPREKERV